MLFLAALLLVQTAPQVTCNVNDLTLPAAYAAWKTPGTTVAPGKAWTFKPEAGSATVNFHIATAGVYSIALSGKGWIDVYPEAAGGEALKSVSHREGESCWTIRKIVRFQLVPGDYRLSVTKLAGPSAEAMLIAGE